MEDERLKPLTVIKLAIVGVLPLAASAIGWW
jgi:hypothetical protein